MVSATKLNNYMKYKIILADCPWSYRNMGNIQATASSHYETMNQRDLEALPVGEIADENSILFMWATFPKIQEALDTIKKWGYEYKTIGFGWMKTNPKNGKPFFGIGWYTKCLEASSKFFVLNTKTNIVKYLTIKDLYNENFSQYKIHSPNGWKQIYNVTNQGAQQNVIINTELGNICCSKNHQLFYKYVTHPRNKTNKEKRDTCHKLTYDTIDIIEDKWKKQKTKKHACNLIFPTNALENPNYLKIINNFKSDGFIFELSDELAWIMGLFVAEGNYTKNQTRFSLSSKEMHFYERIKKYIEDLNMKGDKYFNLPVKVHVHKVSSANAIAVYFSKKVIKNLFQLFILNEGSHNKRLNLDLLLQTSISYRKNFLKGLMDGDGCLTKGKYPRLVLCNKELINDTRILYESLGIMSRKGKGCTFWQGKRHNNYRLSINTDKYNHTFGKFHPHMITINSFKQSSVKHELFDISVEGKQFIFNGILSHNSNLEVCLIGTKGKAPKVSNSVSSIIISPREQHSRKPAETRNKIVEFCGDIPRIELFATEKVKGWTSIGNEIDGKDIRESLQEIINTNKE